MTQIHPNRLTVFPKETKEIFVMGVESRRKKFFLFRTTKSRKKTFNEFEIYVKTLCEKYDYKKFEYFSRKEMYKALQNSRYKDYEEFPFEYFKTTWNQVKPDEEYPEQND